ncbi:MAG: glycosyltransferase, partial [Bacteroidales bacterium]|nr:glycosyltransferase [Bacteroidales bacterium]
LCGANPSPRVLALENKQVTVTGWVDDMREYYAKSRIFIAPMRLGTGLQNKLLEAMSMGIPCITSPLAATPLNAQANQEILVCNSTLGYIDAIDNLLKDAEHYARIARNGQTFVQANYNWEHTSRILEELITE